MKQEITFPLLILFAGMLIIAVTGSAQENYDDWAYSTAVTINTSATGTHTSEDVTNFPYLVRLPMENFDFTQAKANGEDIRFANAGGTHLSYQIDSWNRSKTTAVVWVLVDEIRANDSSQSITMYWGKSDAEDSSDGNTVFSTGNGFVTVWHFSESSQLGDATTNNLTLTNNNTTLQTAGNTGQARTLNGETGTDLSVADNDLLSLTQNITLSGWIHTSDITIAQKILGKSTWPPAGYLVGIEPNTGLFPEFWSPEGSSVSPLGGMIWRKWTHFTVTYAAGDSAYAYVNGVRVAAVSAHTSGLGTNTEPFYIGRAGWSDSELLFSGDVDELRVSNIVRSPSWILLSYASQKQKATALPSITYPERVVVLAQNAPVEIIPTVSGLIDSIVIDPPSLPFWLTFSPGTGAITGTPFDLQEPTQYVITAYNDVGSSSDTIILSVEAVVPIAHGCRNAKPLLIGLRGADGSKIYYSLPAVNDIRELAFTLFDCTGRAVWSSRHTGNTITQGLHVIETAQMKGITSGMYFIEMRIDYTEPLRDDIQRMRTLILH